jgi:hypothetical protein
MNYRDLQNISNLSQEILIEGAKKEHNVLNRWPYTSPYLQENDSQVYELEEGEKQFPHKKVDRKVYDAMQSGETAGDSGNFAKEKKDYGRAERMRSVAAKQGGKSRVKEQVDLYDIILSHLLDEGYAETQEQAEVIMVNMSEDWRESIMEGNVSKKTTKKDAKTREKWYGEKSIERGTDRFSQLQKKAIESGNTKLF